jgi:hypothetical protein
MESSLLLLLLLLCYTGVRCNPHHESWRWCCLVSWGTPGCCFTAAAAVAIAEALLRGDAVALHGLQGTLQDVCCVLVSDAALPPLLCALQACRPPCRTGQVARSSGMLVCPPQGQWTACMRAWPMHWLATQVTQQCWSLA